MKRAENTGIYFIVTGKRVAIFYVIRESSWSEVSTENLKTNCVSLGVITVIGYTDVYSFSSDLLVAFSGH